MSELMRLEVVKTNRFKTIDLNAIDNNPEMSWKAKGIWVYLVSRPPGWKFYFSDLLKRSTDGETSVRNGVKELQDRRYLLIQKIQDEKGRWVGTKWIVTEDPKQLPLPDISVMHVQLAPKTRNAENRDTDNPGSGEHGPSIYHGSKNHSQEEPKKTGSGKPTAPRKQIKYPKDWYKQTLDAYQETRGIELNGPELSPLRQTLKTIFMAGHKPTDVISLMKALEGSEEEWTCNWTLRTVKMKLPLWKAGGLSLGDEQARIREYDQQILAGEAI